MNMYSDGYYGLVKMKPSVFESIDSELLISGCTPSVKFMCANDRETKYLSSIGVKFNDVICDWYKLEIE